VRMAEEQGQMEFLPVNPMSLFPVSSSTLENLAYGNLPMAIPSQSNIPITKTGRKQEVAELAGLLPTLPAASRGVTQGANYLGDVMTQAVTRNPQATSMRALDEIARMSPVPQITTYHGSEFGPFAKFDPTKSSAGTGGQAYGYGAGYTSESPEIAKKYIAANTTMEDATIDGQPFTKYLPEHRASFKVYESGDKEATIKAIEDEIALHQQSKTFPEFARQKIEELSEELQFLRGNEPMSVSSGYLYKGDIPDETLPKFLDWDKKFSDQTPEVQNAVKEYWSKNKVYGDPSKLSGAGIYDSIVAHVFGDAGRSGSQKAASEALSAIGLRGIRYIDPETKRGSKPVSNFIPFSADDYKIQEINEMPVEYYRRRRLIAP
jgi:hypothetical protein